jgi:hypothetical protein
MIRSTSNIPLPHSVPTHPSIRRYLLLGFALAPVCGVCLFSFVHSFVCVCVCVCLATLHGSRFGQVVLANLQWRESVCVCVKVS